MDDQQLRSAAKALGLATVAFGVVPFVAPGFFSTVFGLRRPDDPTVAAAYRSVGVRDVAIGLGIWSAAAHGGNYAPWLLARAICDGGDFVAGLMGILGGARDKRFIGLNALALGAAVTGAALHRQARGQASS